MPLILGTSDDDTLTGSGSDTLEGLSGNDIYYVGVGDLILEQFGEGRDTLVFFGPEIALPANVENLKIGDTVGAAGSGNADENILAGNDGDDTLDGGASADIMAGGPGGDLYVVDHAGDQVMELGNSGNDTVASSVNYDLMRAWHVENLTLTGAAVSGLGNWLNNVVTGNAESNLLAGNKGNDTLIGGAGDDVLLWDAADASVQGGIGTDMLYVDGSGVTLDLTATADSVITDVEVIDITGSGGNTLALSLADVLAISSTTDTLRIDGNAGDIVTAGDGWTENAPNVLIGSRTYAQYTQGSATLQVDLDVNRSGIGVVAFNTLPDGADNTVTISEDTAYTFGAGDFGFTDADPGAGLQAVRIDTLPSAGVLSLSGSTVSAGQIIAAANLGNLVFTPAVNDNGNGYASFSFSVQDNAGSFDVAPNTITLNVTAVNDTPTVSADTGSVTEEGTLTATGTLTVADPDAGESVFQAQTGAATTYGTFSVNATGAWTYDLDNANSAVQGLNSGQTLIDTVSVLTADGTATDVAITINGTDEVGGDITAPTLTSMATSADGSKIVLTYDENLSSNAALPADFTVSSNSLTSDAPILQSAETNGDRTKIILTYNEPLSTTTAATDAFVVKTTSGGTTTNNPVTAVTVAGNTVELTLTNAISSVASDVTVVGYTDSTGLNDANAIQDTTGNDAATLVETRVGSDGVDFASGNGSLFLNLTTPANAAGNGSAAFDLGFTMSQAQTWNGVAGLQLSWDLVTGAFTSNNAGIAMSNPTLGSYGGALTTFRGNTAYALGTAQMSVLAFDPTGNAEVAGEAGSRVMSTANIISNTGTGNQPIASFGPINSQLFNSFGAVVNFQNFINVDPGMAAANGASTAAFGELDFYANGAGTGMSSFLNNWTGFDNTGQYGGQYAGGSATFAGDDKALPFFMFASNTLSGATRAARTAFGVDLDNDGTIEFDNNGATAGGSNEYGLWTLQGDVLTYTNPGAVGANVVTGVAVTGNTVELTLTTPVGGGQSVTVAYADPTAGNDTNATQDTAGNDAGALEAAVLYGGAGNDTLLLDAGSIAQLTDVNAAPAIARIDGRGGIDTLQLDGSGITLDLAAVEAVISSIERVDLTGSGNNTLKLMLNDVLEIGTANAFNAGNTTSGLGATESSVQLRVEGNAGDAVTVTVADPADWGGGTPSGVMIADGQSYNVYNHGGAQLLIDQDISLTFMI